MNRRPTRPGRLAGAAALTFALASGGVAAGTAPAAAAPLPIDQCTTTSGVVLAVDLSRWGGPLLRSCGTTPTTGYALLNQGGWKTTGTGHDGPAFICRIGYSGFQGGKQFPTTDQEKCVLTPPATAYWSYWHADPGQNEWSYSQLGAMSYQPKPGSVDLWIFGGTNIEGTEGVPPSRRTASGPTTPARAGSRPTRARAARAAPAVPRAAVPAPRAVPAAARGPPARPAAPAPARAAAPAAPAPPAARVRPVAPPPPTAPVPLAPPPPAAPARRVAQAVPRPRQTPDERSPSARACPAPGDRHLRHPDDGITPPGAPSQPRSPRHRCRPRRPPRHRRTPRASSRRSSPPWPRRHPAVPGGVVDAAPVADAPHDSGSMVPAVVGTVLVVALGVATVVAARRRRRQAE
ncbi:hypothetical protein ACFQ0M_01950 [Kitasatospora aburaviensis]